jgi:hypothetical protein
VNDEEGLIGVQQGIEAGLAVRFEILVVAKKQKAVSFQRLFAQVVEFLLLISAQAFDGLVHEGHDVIPVKDNVHMGEGFTHRLVVGTAHVHGHSLEPLSFPGKLSEEWEDVLFALSLYGMKDSSCAKIGHHRHVLMPFSDAELVNSDVSDLAKGNFPVEYAQLRFMDLFDHVPAHSQVACDPANGAEVKKIENAKGEGAYIAMLAGYEWKLRPPELVTVHTLVPVEIKNQKALFAADGTHEEPSSLLPLEGGLAATTSGASNEIVGHLCPENHGVRAVVGRFVANTLQPKSVVQYRGGHGREPPFVVRVESNNRVLAMSISHFATPRYSFAG